MKFVVIAGTNRKGSRTGRLARHVMGRYADLGVDVSLLDLVDLPMEALHPSAYGDKPSSVQPFLDDIQDADGLVVVVPEYNGSFPGVLKLWIDLLPFPESFEGRPVAFVGLSAGRWGGLRAVEQLQGIWGYRNGVVFPERVFVHSASSQLADDGTPTDPLVARLLDIQVRRYTDFCGRLEGWADGVETP